jgi:hypothetical protein
LHLCTLSYINSLYAFEHYAKAFKVLEATPPTEAPTGKLVIRVAAIQPTAITVLQHAAIAQVAATALLKPQQREQTDTESHSALKDSSVSDSTTGATITADRAPAFGIEVSSATASSTQDSVLPQQQQQQPQQQRSQQQQYASQIDVQQQPPTTAAIENSANSNRSTSSSSSSSSSSTDSSTAVQPHFVRYTHTTGVQAVPTQQREQSSSSSGSDADNVEDADNTPTVPHNTPVKPDIVRAQQHCDSTDSCDVNSDTRQFEVPRYNVGTEVPTDMQKHIAAEVAAVSLSDQQQQQSPTAVKAAASRQQLYAQCESDCSEQIAASKHSNPDSSSDTDDDVLPDDSTDSQCFPGLTQQWNRGSAADVTAGTTAGTAAGTAAADTTAGATDATAKRESIHRIYAAAAQQQRQQHHLHHKHHHSSEQLQQQQQQRQQQQQQQQQQLYDIEHNTAARIVPPYEGFVPDLTLESKQREENTLQEGDIVPRGQGLRERGFAHDTGPIYVDDTTDPQYYPGLEQVSGCTHW